ncbi:MAG: hypothetical protein ACT4P8_12000 [Betaproteobacteria bacterium]
MNSGLWRPLSCLARVVLIATLAWWPVAATAYGFSGHLRLICENWEPLIGKDLRTNSRNGKVLLAASLGALFNDLGYASDKQALFSDAVHYLHSWNFAGTAWRLAQSDKYKNADFYRAFARGVASHQWGDRYGHYYGTNVIVSRVIRRQGPRPPNLPLRVAYESNKKIHQQVEARAVNFDWKEASDEYINCARSFVFGFSDYPTLAAELAEFASEVINEQFPGLTAVITAQHVVGLWKFTSDLLCAGLSPGRNVVRDKALADMKAPCERLKTVSEKDLDTLTKETLACLINVPLSDKEDEERLDYATYQESHRVISRLLRRPPPQADTNLDTGLPVAAGTYGMSDAALRSVFPRHTYPIVQRYVDSGKEVRAFFSQRIDSIQAAQALLSDPRLDGFVEGWLKDIYPDLQQIRFARLTILPKCVGDLDPVALESDVSRARLFRGRSETSLCVAGSASFIEVLYGVYASLPGGGANDTKVRLQQDYAEALDRLRLESTEAGKIDSKTGLYEQGKRKAIVGPDKVHCP